MGNAIFHHTPPCAIKILETTDIHRAITYKIKGNLLFEVRPCIALLFFKSLLNEIVFQIITKWDLSMFSQSMDKLRLDFKVLLSMI